MRTWLSWILSAAMFLLGSQSFAGENLHWVSYHEALQESHQDHRPIFLFFTGSTWCIWCKRLESEVLSQDVFKKFIESRCHLVKLDFPRQGNIPPLYQDLKQQYHVTGFPTVIIISHEGEPLLTTGYRPGGAEAYIDYLSSHLFSRETAR